MMTNNKKHLYIIGAGFAGQTIADDIKRKKIFGTVSAFLDDDKNLIGTKIDDIPVIGPIENVASALRCSEQDEAIIAIKKYRIFPHKDSSWNFTSCKWRCTLSANQRN